MLFGLLMCYSSTQLYARRHFLFPPLSIDVYNERVKSVVRCEGQVSITIADSTVFLD